MKKMTKNFEPVETFFSRNWELKERNENAQRNAVYTCPQFRKDNISIIGEDTEERIIKMSQQEDDTSY